MVISFIGFGSNLGDRYATWEKTLNLLGQVEGLRILRTSTPVETDPLGPIQNQPRFLNAVIQTETTLEPLALLDALMAIERQLGRVRAERWGPRTVDLDILLYGDQIIDLPQLKIPHPELNNRAFLTRAIAGLNSTEAQLSA